MIAQGDEVITMNHNLTEMDAKISEAGYNDLESILALQKTAYQREADLINDYSIPPLQQTIADIREEFIQTRFLKAEIDGRIVGSVRAEIQDETCLIKRLIVHPDYQNRGIGSKLLVSGEEIYPHVRRFELFTGSESKSNHLFYTRRGYSPFREVTISDKLTLIYFEKRS